MKIATAESGKTYIFDDTNMMSDEEIIEFVNDTGELIDTLEDYREPE